MRIIYPALMKQYNTYIKNTNKNAMREFQMTIDEMLEMPRSELSERQKDFLRYYESRMPVGNHDCVMNRIWQAASRRSSMAILVATMPMLTLTTP